MSVESNPGDYAVAFRTWIIGNGGRIDCRVDFVEIQDEVLRGLRVEACEDIPAGTTVVSIPFSLAITPEVAITALSTVLGVAPPSHWLERQLICSYLCFHWILKTPVLKHRPYVDVLPHPRTLRTPLHFTLDELDHFKCTNLYGATEDRRREWIAEWEQCREFVKNALSGGDIVWTEFTWERYLAAATYLSSRAFPSTILSRTPSLGSTPSSYPVLLPGIDSLNHARGQPVSWVVTYPDQTPTAKPESESTTAATPSISLILHNSTPVHHELFNNYGPKPNAELILGYGFSLPNNPDDTIVLQIGGGSQGGGKKWEVGREARGVEGVLAEVRAAVTQAVGAEEKSRSYEDDLDAAYTLMDMVQGLLDRLPGKEVLDNTTVLRTEVKVMLEHYLEGQHAILKSIIQFAQEEADKAMELAREAGLELIEEEEDEEDETAT